MMHKVEVFEDNDHEMVKIVVNGEMVFHGNTWDIHEDTWISILSKCGVLVITSEYSYSYE